MVRPEEKLDDEMIENLTGTRQVNEALAALKQCHIARFHMTIHSPSTREEARR
jgi:hypothetical protein